MAWIGSAFKITPYQRRFVDTWTLLGAIAAVTTRVGFFPDVANLPLRPPAVMAKAAASLDVLSGGRFELALGAGSFWDAIEAYGGPRREPRDALAALQEAIQVIHLIWSGERNLRFEGAHYRLGGRTRAPSRSIRLASGSALYGPRALRLAGRLADGWVPSLRGETSFLRDGAARIDDAAAAAGRDPADVRRVLNVNGQITDGGAWACSAVQSTNGSMSSPILPSATASTPSCSGATAKINFRASPKKSPPPYALRSPPSAVGGRLSESPHRSESELSQESC